MVLPQPYIFIVGTTLVVLLGVAALAHALVMLLVMVGVLWSPIAAYFARRRGQETCAAPKTSALMFLPWLYLQSKVRGHVMSPRSVRLGYRVLYTLWLFGPVGLWIGLFVAVVPLNIVWTAVSLARGSGWQVLYESRSVDLLAVIGTLALVAFVTLLAYACTFGPIVSWKNSLKKLREFHQERALSGHARSQTGIETEYLAPFLYVIGWTFATPVLYIVGTLIYLAAIRPTF